MHGGAFVRCFRADGLLEDRCRERRRRSGATTSSRPGPGAAHDRGDRRLLRLLCDLDQPPGDQYRQLDQHFERTARERKDPGGARHVRRQHPLRVRERRGRAQIGAADASAGARGSGRVGPARGCRRRASKAPRDVARTGRLATCQPRRARAADPHPQRGQQDDLHAIGRSEPQRPRTRLRSRQAARPAESGSGSAQQAPGRRRRKSSFGGEGKARRHAARLERPDRDLALQSAEGSPGHREGPSRVSRSRCR